MTNSVVSERTAGVQSVERALAILVAIGEAAEPMTLSEIARRVNLHPATVHRLQRTLIASGFIAQDLVTQRYRLGEVFLTLARSHDLRENLSTLALPFLESLVAATGETAGLLQLDAHATVVIARVLSSHPLHVHSPIGGHGPVHATAVGKLLLAYAPDETWEAVLAQPLLAFTAQTLTRPADLRRELRSIRDCGYAIGVEDYYEGVTTLAAPVFGPHSTVVAGVSTSGPSSRITADQISTVLMHVRTVAADLSAALGHYQE